MRNPRGTGPVLLRRVRRRAQLGPGRCRPHRAARRRHVRPAPRLRRLRGRGRAPRPHRPPGHGTRRRTGRRHRGEPDAAPAAAYGRRRGQPGRRRRGHHRGHTRHREHPGRRPRRGSRRGPGRRSGSRRPPGARHRRDRPHRPGAVRRRLRARPERAHRHHVRPGPLAARPRRRPRGTRPGGAPAVAPVLPGRPDADRPQVRAPGHQPDIANGPPCPWCSTPNRPDRHYCARCAMPLVASGDQASLRAPWWRRLFGGRRQETPWAGDRPRLRRVFDRIGTWITVAVVATLAVLGFMYIPDGVQNTRDHFAKRAPSPRTASRPRAPSPATIPSSSSTSSATPGGGRASRSPARASGSRRASPSRPGCST